MQRRRSGDEARAIVLVGHCRPDAWMLASMVRRAAPEWRVEMASSDEELRRLLDEADLLLVNRQLDGLFEDDSGIALIERFAGDKDAPAIMLVSNFPDAHEAALKAGAIEGFGKRDLNSPRVAELVRAALSRAEDA
ncbi:MAG: hypothetical protein R3B57_10370 [Phycisphaerales bacterium]